MKNYLAGLAVVSMAAIATSASASLLIYEPFDQAPGSAIVGQTNTYTGNVWNEVGSLTPPANQVTSGSLTAPAGFPASQGNAATIHGTAGSANSDIEADRLNIPDAFNPDTTPKYGTNSTLYYSVLLNVSDLTGLTVDSTNLNANNDGIIAFNNQQGGTAAHATIWAGELVIRLGSDAGTYNLGIRASNTPGGTNPGHTYWSGDISDTSGTHLIVASFTRGSGAYGSASNGTNSLWIDPDPTTFGAAVAPSADGTSQGVMGGSGTDSDGDQSLIINNNIGGPGTMVNSLMLDELRVGTTWADVTSVPEPASLSLLGLGALAACTRRRKTA